MDANINNSDELLQLVSFKLGREEFGIDILKVQEINRMLDITEVPEADEFIEGIINLRGKVIPVVNLRLKLKMQSKEYDNATRIVVVELNDSVVGFIVDEVSEVFRIPTSITEPPPSFVAGIESDFITAIGKLENRLLILLDLEKLLSIDELKILEKIND